MHKLIGIALLILAIALIAMVVFGEFVFTTGGGIFVLILLIIGGAFTAG